MKKQTTSESLWKNILVARKGFYQQAQKENDDTASFFWPETKHPEYSITIDNSTHPLPIQNSHPLTANNFLNYIFTYKTTTNSHIEYHFQINNKKGEIKKILFFNDHDKNPLVLSKEKNAIQFWGKYFESEAIEIVGEIIKLFEDV